MGSDIKRNNTNLDVYISAWAGLLMAQVAQMPNSQKLEVGKSNKNGKKKRKHKN